MARPVSSFHIRTVRFVVFHSNIESYYAHGEASPRNVRLLKDGCGALHTRRVLQPNTSVGADELGLRLYFLLLEAHSVAARFECCYSLTSSFSLLFVDSFLFSATFRLQQTVQPVYFETNVF
jgi:hypothetical protein